jgi:DNA polymerase
MIPTPPATSLSYGQKLLAGVGQSTVLADLDFETYSEAGYVWNEDTQKWSSPVANKAAGIGCVGAQVYAEHPTTEILTMAYDLKDGKGKRVWTPLQPFPDDLRQHIADGKLVAAWNSSFEEKIWRLVGIPKYGFPELPLTQLRCDMAKSRAFCWPGALGKAGPVAGLAEEDLKLKEGSRIIKRYCCPRTPTKKDARKRIHPLSDGAEGLDLYKYNAQDIHTEAMIAAKIPDLPQMELDYWLVDQECNRRGVKMDEETIDAMIEILDEIYAEVEKRCPELTNGAVNKPSEVQKMIAFLAGRGVHVSSLDEDAVTEALESTDDPVAAELLTMRKYVSSASVKKAYTMKRMLSREGRLHDLFIYHSARTGRDAGADAQPQNLQSGGPKVSLCRCGTYYCDTPICPTCGMGAFAANPSEWNAEAAEQAIELIRNRDRAGLDARYGSAVYAMGGCLRGLFVADEGHDFIATDYSSIEAVVAAALAGEQWRLDTFARKEDIYLASVSQIFGTPVEEYTAYKKETGMHHPDRKIGKVAELASGFGGWVGAWRAFGAEDVFETEKDLKNAILAWRKASPAIVEMWGGQFRGRPWDPDYRPELYGLEGMAIAAVMNPTEEYRYRGIEYTCVNDVLYCTLPSGRRISYHEPRLVADTARGGVKLSFMGWNSNPKMGSFGWVRMETYGGKLFENVVQATARDILANAAINCEKSGYKVILRVHDELVTQVPKGTGSVEQLEEICGQMPAWAEGWPVRAAGGWRGKRYRKE